MQLSSINEALGRRDFMKTAATVAGAPNKLDAISKAAGKIAAKVVPNFARQIAAYKSSGIEDHLLDDIVVNFANGGTAYPDGRYWLSRDRKSGKDTFVSKDVITGYLADRMSQDQDHIIYNMTGGTPLGLNEFDNVLQVYSDKLFSKLGPEGFIQAVRRVLAGDGSRLSGDYFDNGDQSIGKPPISVTEDFICTIQNAVNVIPDLGEIIDVEQLDKGAATAARELFNKKLITKDQAKVIINTDAKWRAANKEARKTGERDVIDKSMEDELETRDHKDPDLSRWADDGGTALENKLNKALKLVW